MGAACLDHGIELSGTVFDGGSEQVERRQQAIFAFQSGTDMNRCRDRIVAALPHIDVIIRAHLLSGDPTCQGRHDFIHVHVGTGARAGLEDIDRELFKMPAFQNFARSRLDGA